MLLQKITNKQKKYNKSLSISKRCSIALISFLKIPADLAKALRYAHHRGSYTVEAACVLPLFVFAAAAILGFFPMLRLQAQVNSGLQYAARRMAVTWQDESSGSEMMTLLQGKVIFYRYLKEHHADMGILCGISGVPGSKGISLLHSDTEGDYVTLVADYKVALPVTFWKIHALPVRQCVRVKKWTGADPDSGQGEDALYVYVTPEGNAYHRSTECAYLKLSIRSVPVTATRFLRSSDGSKYYPCSCYHGEAAVYITSYGTEYHGNLGCGGLKRTILKVRKDQTGDRHACPKCGG